MVIVISVNCAEMTENLACLMKLAFTSTCDAKLIMCFQKSMVTIHDRIVHTEQFTRGGGELVELLS